MYRGAGRTAGACLSGRLATGMKRVTDVLWGGLDELGVADADPVGGEEQRVGKAVSGRRTRRLVDRLLGARSWRRKRRLLRRHARLTRAGARRRLSRLAARAVDERRDPYVYLLQFDAQLPGTPRDPAFSARLAGLRRRPAALRGHSHRDPAGHPVQGPQAGTPMAIHASMNTQTAVLSLGWRR
jgi:hypothetical protein